MSALFCKLFPRSSVSIALLSTCLPTYALNPTVLADLSQHLISNPRFPTDPFVVHDMKDDLLFEENAEQLGQLNIQVAAKLMDRDEFKRDHEEKWDLDGLLKPVRAEDQIFLAKSAALFHNVKPEFFSASSISDLNFLQSTKHETKCEVVNREENIIKHSKRAYGLTFSAKIHYASYNFQTGEAQGIDEAFAKNLLSRFSRGQGQPVVIATEYSKQEDVNRGSFGGRTVHLYYQVNQKDTLLVSYRFLTIKKEDIFWGPLWTMVKGAAQPKLFETLTAETKKKRAYFLEGKGKREEL